MNRESLVELRHLQIKVRFDWPAVFSANPNGEIWPFRTNGKTPDFLKINVRGMSPVLDDIAAIFLGTRKEGGRFFVDDRGACYKELNKECVWFY